MQRSWNTITSWEWVEPTVHRAPIPVALYRCLVVTGLWWGWFRFVGCVVAGFRGIVRPIEILTAERGQLALPSDCLNMSSKVLVSTPCAYVKKPRKFGQGLNFLKKLSGGQGLEKFLIVFVCAPYLGICRYHGASYVLLVATLIDS